MNPPRPITRSLTLAVKVSVISAIAFLLWSQFHALDIHEALSLLRRMGPLAVIPFLPYAFVTMLDARGWRHTMPVPRDIPMREISAIRLATDAVMNTFPAGVAFAETLRPFLLQKRLRMRWSDALAVTIVAKINIAITQMLFLLAGLALAAISYSGPLKQTGVFATPAAGIGAAAAAALFTGALFLPYSGGRLTQLASILEHIPLDAVKQFIRRGRIVLTEIDGYLNAFRLKRKSRLLHSLGYFMLSWCVMAMETWLILTLLGANVTIVQAVIIESIAALVKLLFFFIPSGLGAQEISFAALLSALIGPEALALSAAFIVIRRGKELAWAGIGLGLFGYLGINPFHIPLQKSRPA
ncbi:MAG: flippase-like domain-containing protein [Bacteroidetes bacterium]|nr:flippase-like domain-containing protein [Bacteroidota bacterium]